MNKFKHVSGYLQFRSDFQALDLKIDEAEITKEFNEGKRVWTFPDPENKGETVEVHFDNEGIPIEDTYYMEDESLIRFYYRLRAPEVLEKMFDDMKKDVTNEDGTVNEKLKKFLEQHDPRSQSSIDIRNKMFDDLYKGLEEGTVPEAIRKLVEENDPRNQ